MNRIITIAIAALMALMVTSVAIAQDDPFTALVGITSGESAGMSSIRNVPWMGAHDDPLTPMIRWGTAIDPSVCWVGVPPDGWSYHSARYTLENKTRQMMRLDLDGAIIDVVSSRYAGRAALPAMVLAKTPSGVQRFTALGPGEICYGVLTDKDAYAARGVGWRLHASELAHTGAPGRSINIGGARLYTGPLRQTGAIATEQMYRRSGTSGRGFRLILDPYQF